MNWQFGGGWHRGLVSRAILWATGMVPVFLPGRRLLIDHERHAYEVVFYAAGSIPEIVQTEDYARLRLGGDPNLSSLDIEERLIQLQNRQGMLLQKGHSSVTVYVPRSALVSDRDEQEVLRAQCEYMQRLAAENRGFTIEVVPDDCVPFRDFEILVMPERTKVYIENELVALLFTKDRHVQRFMAMWTRLRLEALDEDESRELLADLLGRDGNARTS
jgi:hypothetical protein